LLVDRPIAPLVYDHFLGKPVTPLGVAAVLSQFLIEAL
jgi:hypothetical protein